MKNKLARMLEFFFPFLEIRVRPNPPEPDTDVDWDTRVREHLQALGPSYVDMFSNYQHQIMMEKTRRELQEEQCVDPSAPIYKCCVCGEPVHSCEREEPVDNDWTCPVHPDGAELHDGRWVCSPECDEAIALEQDDEHPEFHVGDIVKVRDDIWEWYLDRASQWESPVVLDMKTHQPQPIERIDPVRGVKLALPHWWFKFGDIEHVKH